MESINLYHGNCLEGMDRMIERGIKVDAIICDPPYGTTKCKWDSLIPFGDMWERLNKIVKENGVIVLFGSQPFTSALILSNTYMFKYEWIWEKTMPTGAATSSFMPMKYHENICIFVNKGKPTFNKQLEERSEAGKVRAKTPIHGNSHKSNHVNMGKVKPKQYNINKVNPKTVLKFNSVANSNGKLHPTQKPVALMEYLIKTYTNEGEAVLDFTMGSGTTGVACVNLNRKFIGIELEESYFYIAKERIENIKEPTDV